MKFGLAFQWAGRGVWARRMPGDRMTFDSAVIYSSAHQMRQLHVAGLPVDFTLTPENP